MLLFPPVSPDILYKCFQYFNLTGVAVSLIYTGISCEGWCKSDPLCFFTSFEMDKPSSKWDDGLFCPVEFLHQLMSECHFYQVGSSNFL